MKKYIKLILFFLMLGSGYQGIAMDSIKTFSDKDFESLLDQLHGFNDGSHEEKYQDQYDGDGLTEEEIASCRSILHFSRLSPGAREKIQAAVKSQEKIKKEKQQRELREQKKQQKLLRQAKKKKRKKEKARDAAEMDQIFEEAVKRANIEREELKKQFIAKTKREVKSGQIICECCGEISENSLVKAVMYNVQFFSKKHSISFKSEEVSACFQGFLDDMEASIDFACMGQQVTRNE